MTDKSSTDAALDWDYPQSFVLDLTAKSEHIDGLNHVNNAVYVTWCEDSAWSHSADLGLSLTDYQSLNRAMAIRRSEFEYLQAAYLGDELKVATWLTATDNRLSLERRFQIIRARDNVTVLRARWELICIDFSSGRSKRMPTRFKTVYGGAVSELNVERQNSRVNSRNNIADQSVINS